MAKRRLLGSLISGGSLRGGAGQSIARGLWVRLQDRVARLEKALAELQGASDFSATAEGLLPAERITAGSANESQEPEPPEVEPAVQDSGCQKGLSSILDQLHARIDEAEDASALVNLQNVYLNKRIAQLPSEIGKGEWALVSEAMRQVTETREQVERVGAEAQSAATALRAQLAELRLTCPANARRIASSIAKGLGLPAGGLDAPAGLAAGPEAAAAEAEGAGDGASLEAELCCRIELGLEGLRRELRSLAGQRRDEPVDPAALKALTAELRCELCAEVGRMTAQRHDEFVDGAALKAMAAELRSEFHSEVRCLTSLRCDEPVDTAALKELAAELRSEFRSEVRSTVAQHRDEPADLSTLKALAAELRSELCADVRRLREQLEDVRATARAEPKADRLLEALDLKVSDRQLQDALADVRREVSGIKGCLGDRVSQLEGAVHPLKEEIVKLRGFTEGFAVTGGLGALVRRLGDVEASTADLRATLFRGRREPVQALWSTQTPPSAARPEAQPRGAPSDLEAAFGHLRERLANLRGADDQDNMHMTPTTSKRFRQR